MRTGRIIGIAAVLLAAGASGVNAQTHAPWPSDWNNYSDPNLWVTVSNPGNAPDMRYAAPGYPYWGNGLGFGGVGYTFQMGKFDVTAGQYCSFLNAVARTDTFGLYNASMGTPAISWGCNISQTGTAGSYVYSVGANWANRPVNFVSWGDGARFCNWLTNGQPTGPQDANTTEDGSYSLNGATSIESLQAVSRITDASRAPDRKYYFIPSEDEWYKAAYYDSNRPGDGKYWMYPTRSDVPPSNYLDPNGTNNANYRALGYTIGTPYYRTEVGAFASSPSPCGTFDQSGNVWNWTEGSPYSTQRSLRGGAFSGGGDSQASYFNTNDPTQEYASIGFRISEVPEPATMTLLALGGIGLLRRRK